MSTESFKKKKLLLARVTSVEAVLCMQGFQQHPLSSTCLMSVATAPSTHHCDNQKCFSIAKCPLGSKSPQIKNHCFRQILRITAQSQIYQTMCSIFYRRVILTTCIFSLYADIGTLGPPPTRYDDSIVEIIHVKTCSPVLQTHQVGLSLLLGS